MQNAFVLAENHEGDPSVKMMGPFANHIKLWSRAGLESILGFTCSVSSRRIQR